MLGRVVEPDDAAKGDELKDEANPKDVLPVAASGIDGVSSDDGTDDDDDEDHAVGNTDANMAVLVGHELRDRAHGHLTETCAETSYAQTGGELHRGVGRGGDDEANAADDVSDDEDDATTEEIAVRAGEDEGDGIGGGVSRDLNLHEKRSVRTLGHLDTWMWKPS